MFINSRIHQLKMMKEHFDSIKSAISTVLANHPGSTLEIYESHGLSPMRWRWDLFNCACDMKLIKVSVFYKYLDDTHVDTALRKITNTK